MAQALDVAEGTVFRTQRRFAETGLAGVLQRPAPGPSVPEAGRPGRSPPHRAGLLAEPPAGHEHWTLRLLAGKVVELGLAPSLSHETVRLHLKKTLSSRGRSRSGASPR